MRERQPRSPLPKPIVGSFPCECAASGQAQAPPTSVMNSRRRISRPRLETLGYLRLARLGCQPFCDIGRVVGAMSALGQKQNVRLVSTLPPKADIG